jgi:alpha-1,6-mannosyltransferase
VLGSFGLSAHNDALMLGLLICGLAVATRDRRIAGIPPVLLAVALCTLAAMVKSPAGIAVLFLALTWARRVGSPLARLARVGLCAGVAGVVVALCTALSGVGWAWVSPAALSSPARVSTPFTPATAITNALVGLGRLVGFAVPRTQVLHVVLGVTLAAALAFTVGLLIRHHRIGTARALGLSLLTIVLAAPVTWPWYLCWGVALLAAAMPARRVLGLILLASVALLLVQPDGDAQDLGIAVTTLLAAASLVLAGYAVGWCVRYFRRPAPAAPMSAEARR